MRKTKLAFRIIKKMNVDKIIIGYLIMMFVASIILWRVEPQIDSILNGIWYCFVTFTTIGFGDIVAVTFIGRIVTIVIALYGIIIVALISSVLISYYQELNKIKLDTSIENFLEKLEKLPELSKEELEEISEKVKNRKYRL